MIQSAQVASKFTLFTHHAKTFPDLVTALRNSMLRAGVFNNERIAEQQVVQVLNFDIHLAKDFRGKRFVERITECIPVEERNEYLYDYDGQRGPDDRMTLFMKNATNYFTKVTNRELFKHQNIIEYHEGEYVITNAITPKNIREMINNMDDADSDSFKVFCKKHWNIIAKRDSDVDEEKKAAQVQTQQQ